MAESGKTFQRRKPISAGAAVSELLRSQGRVFLARHSLNPQRQADIYGGMGTMTEFNLNETVAVLARTPATLDALLRGLPESWVRSNESKVPGAHATLWAT
jgi:hypothetical protein